MTILATIVVLGTLYLALRHADNYMRGSRFNTTTQSKWDGEDLRLYSLMDEPTNKEEY